MKDKKSGEQFEKLVEIIETLRSPQGCPWDREQDEKSIANYFLEEVYEAVDAVATDDPSSLVEELGDVMMEVIFLAQIYKERGEFDIAEVLDGIVEKMRRRHPHVFGRQKIDSSRKVIEQWEKHKKEEKERASFFDGLAASSPSLLAAFQIGQRAATFGFDWSSPLEVLEKVKEEWGELERALEEGKEHEIFEELGDIFFSLANLSRKLGLNPEIALRRANEKFKQRFETLAQKLKSEGKELGETCLAEMDRIWEFVKNKKNHP